MPVLRPRLGMIPQEALLLRGTVRENLDPWGEHPDEALRAALQKARFGGRVPSCFLCAKDIFGFHFHVAFPRRARRGSGTFICHHTRLTSKTSHIRFIFFAIMLSFRRIIESSTTTVACTFGRRKRDR